MTEQYKQWIVKKILNLLNEKGDFKFVTKKWNIVNDKSNSNFEAGNEIIYKTVVLKSNRWDFNDAYILVRDDITIKGHEVTRVAFKLVNPLLDVSQKLMEKQ